METIPQGIKTQIEELAKTTKTSVEQVEKYIIDQFNNEHLQKVADEAKRWDSAWSFTLVNYPKFAKLKPIIDNVPEEMRSLPNWVLYNQRKNPFTENYAASDASDPKTWSTFERICGAYRNGDNRFIGIGFEFGLANQKSGLVGIDFDSLKDENGNKLDLHPAAYDEIRKFTSYTELSPSGKGFHIICKGALPSDGELSGKGKKVEIFDNDGNHLYDIEMYDFGRFFTFTGEVWEGKNKIIDQQEEVTNLYNWLVEMKKQNKAAGRSKENKELKPVTGITVEERFNEALGNCRKCFREAFKNGNSNIWKGGSGHDLNIAFIAELKVNGAGLEEVNLFCQKVYAKYDLTLTRQNFEGADADKTWTCERIQQELPVETSPEICERCKEEMRLKFDMEERSALGEVKLYGCVVPEGYVIEKGKVCIIKQKKIDGELIGIPMSICDIPVMVTGKLKGLDAENYVMVTFRAEQKEKTVNVPQVAIQHRPDFIKYLSSQGLVVADSDINAVTKYLSSCLITNTENPSGAFKFGSVNVATGWNEDFTQFNLPSHSIRFENGELVKYPAVFVDIAKTNIAKKIGTKGTLEDWKKGIEPYICCKRVRFACYNAMGTILIAILGANPSTTGFQNQTSTGKTWGLRAASSLIGEPKKGGMLYDGGSSLFHIQKVIGTCRDLPVFYDDIRNMKEDLLKGLVYAVGNGLMPGKGQSDQTLKPDIIFRSNLIITTELNFISESSPDGAPVRAKRIQGEVIPIGDSTKLEEAQHIIEENYGHILDLFLLEVFRQKDELRRIYTSIKQTLRNQMLNKQDIQIARKAEIYAVDVVAGMLLEKVFGDIGFEKVDPLPLVEEIWNECEIESRFEPLYIRGLRIINDFFSRNASSSFIDEDYITKMKSMMDSSMPFRLKNVNTFGWYNDEYFDPIKTYLTSELKKNDIEAPAIDEIYRQLIQHGIIEVKDVYKDGPNKGKPKGVTSGISHTQPDGKKKTESVIHINRRKMNEALGIDEIPSDIANVVNNIIDAEFSKTTINGGIASLGRNWIPKSEQPGNKYLVDPQKDENQNVGSFW